MEEDDQTSSPVILVVVVGGGGLGFARFCLHLLATVTRVNDAIECLLPMKGGRHEGNKLFTYYKH